MSAVVRGRAFLDRITPGPWEYAHDVGQRMIYDDATCHMCIDITANGAGSSVEDADLEFVAAAPGLVRDLCDEIDARTAYLEGDLEMCQANRAHTALQFREMRAERDVALAAIQRIRAQHPPFSLPNGTQLCETCEDKYSYPFDWPCPTIQALGDQT